MNSNFFPRTSSKRRKGFPSETSVKRGFRVVHGRKELVEKLGRNDPCPCRSGRTFQEVLHADWSIRRYAANPLPSVVYQGARSPAVPFPF